MPMCHLNFTVGFYVQFLVNSIIFSSKVKVTIYTAFFIGLDLNFQKKESKQNVFQKRKGFLS